jgi:uncharacterized membrane protein YfcA
MWKAIVRHGVDVFDRSLALCALAFMGAAALFILLKVFYSSGLRSHFWILGTSTVFSMLATVPVHSALQKYREIPILSIFPFLVVAVSLLASSTGPRWRSLNFALTIAASVQTVAALGTVVFPYGALDSAGSGTTADDHRDRRTLGVEVQRDRVTLELVGSSRFPQEHRDGTCPTHWV